MTKPKKKTTKVVRKVRGTASLPGMEDARIEELDTAAYAYADAKDDTALAKKNEKDKKEKLADVMVKHSLKRYFNREAKLLAVFIEGHRDVKVKRIKEGKSK